MRKHKNIKLKGGKTYAFVVDGETEVWYLQMLKRNEKALQVDIQPKLPTKKSLDKQYEMVESLSNDYTKVFWIVDYDVIYKETREVKQGKEKPEDKFSILREKAHKIENVEVIVNNPCLEFWFLIHYIKTSKHYSNCETVIRQLNKYLPKYEKTRKFYTKQDNDIYLKTKKHLSMAIKNSIELPAFNRYDTAQAFCEMNKIFISEDIKNIVLK